MKQGQSGQLSRYGAISKKYPFTTGKVFFLVNSTESAAADFLNRYTPDDDGRVRVFTTWASVITEIQVSTDADVVMVSPMFTTAPTKVQQLALDAAYVSVIQAGSILPDGSYVAATLTALNLANATITTLNLFQVNGRIELIDIQGEVVTTIGSTGTNAKLTHVPTVGSTTDLCATATTTSLSIGMQMLITGTLANAMVTTTQAVFVKQATGLVLQAGVLSLVTPTTTSGNVKWRMRYRAIDPGAFVSPLI